MMAPLGGNVSALGWRCQNWTLEQMVDLGMRLWRVRSEIYKHSKRS